VCQETFLRAFRAIRGFKGQAKFSSWRYGITLISAATGCAASARAPIVQAPRGVDLIELAAEPEGGATVEDLLSRARAHASVARVMATLPEEQRTAIILKEYHGLTFQEIADLIDCPLSTVKTRLYQD